jgi:HlyD family secretion protein
VRDGEGDRQSPQGLAGQRLSVADLRLGEAPRRSGARWAWGAAALVLVLAALAGAVLRGLRDPVLATVSVRPLASSGEARAGTITASGYVEADTQVDLVPRITSSVTEILVEEGARVAQGQVLARLDAREYQARLAEAEADLRHQDARLGRLRKLRAADFSSPAELEEAETAAATARARVELLRVQVGHSVVRAPFDGVVTRRHANVGEVVGPFSAAVGQLVTSEPILTLVDFSTLYVAADISEGELERLEVGRPAEVELEAYPRVVFEADVIRIARSVDRQRGTVTAHVRFREPDPRVLPGLSARVRIAAAASSAAEREPASLPASALGSWQGREGVLVVEGGVVHFHAVTVGRRAGEMVEVVSGPAAGSLVVDPFDLSLARPGTSVRTIPWTRP